MLIDETEKLNDELMDLTSQINEVKHKEKVLESGRRELESSLLLRQEETGRLFEMVHSLESKKKGAEVKRRELEKELVKMKREAEERKEEGKEGKKREEEVEKLRRMVRQGGKELREGLLLFPSQQHVDQQQAATRTATHSH